MSFQKFELIILICFKCFNAITLSFNYIFILYFYILYSKNFVLFPSVPFRFHYVSFHLRVVSFSFHVVEMIFLHFQFLVKIIFVSLTVLFLLYLFIIQYLDFILYNTDSVLPFLTKYYILMITFSHMLVR